MRNLNARVPDLRSLYTNRGVDIEPIYVPGLDESGNAFPKACGERNIQKEIDSHVDECDMSVIVARLQAGDTSVINRTEPVFGDTTIYPKTPAEALQLVIDGQRAFDTLPADVRAKFGNDFNRWFSSAGSDSWLDSMGLVNSVKEPVVEKPVVKEGVTVES